MTKPFISSTTRRADTEGGTHPQSQLSARAGRRFASLRAANVSQRHPLTNYVNEDINNPQDYLLLAAFVSRFIFFFKEYVCSSFFF